MPITLVESDARVEKITVSWNPTTNGAVSSYIVRLIDGNSQVADVTVQGQSITQAQLSYDGMKNGYWYSIHIVSQSQAFGEITQYVISAEITESIKTDVQGKHYFILLKCISARM